MKVFVINPMMLLGEGGIWLQVEGVLDQAMDVVRLHGVEANQASEPHLAAGRGPFRDPQELLGMSLRRRRQGRPTAGTVATGSLRWRRRRNRRGRRLDATAMPLRRRRGMPAAPYRRCWRCVGTAV